MRTFVQSLWASNRLGALAAAAAGGHRQIKLSGISARASTAPAAVPISCRPAQQLPGDQNTASVRVDFSGLSEGHHRGRDARSYSRAGCQRRVNDGPSGLRSRQAVSSGRSHHVLSRQGEADAAEHRALEYLQAAAVPLNRAAGLVVSC